MVRKQINRNPKDWNWTAIITWSIIGYAVHFIFSHIYSFLTKL